MRSWLFGFIVACVGALAMDARAQQGETRIALIIANEAYVSPNLGRLPGTRRDAATMQAALRQAGFQVSVRIDLTLVQMRSELSAFERRLRELGPSGVGFLYYSGHGVADGPHGQNYLIPIDAQISDITDLPTNALAMNNELDAIDLAGARATIVVIDACRNTIVSIGRGGRGLASVPEHTDTLIAFSTQPNDTAADDGLYAQMLARDLVQPGVNAVDVFARVTQDVADRTHRRQVPRYDNGLIESLVFVPPSGSSPVVAMLEPTTTAPPLAPAISEPDFNNVASRGGDDLNSHCRIIATDGSEAQVATRAVSALSNSDWSTLGDPELACRVLANASAASLIAAAESDDRALTVLATAYRCGIIANTDAQYDQVFQRLQQAASRGFARAQFEYGRSRENIDPIHHPGIWREAQTWFVRAAAQGNAVAAVWAAQNLFPGSHNTGISANPTEAARLLQLAAVQGVAAGQYGLAYMYENGAAGLPTSPEEAIRLYRLAERSPELRQDARDALQRLGAPISN